MLEPIALPLDRTDPWIVAWRRLSEAAAPYLVPEFPLLAARLASERKPILFGAADGTELRAALPLAKRGRTLVGLRTDHTPRFDMAGDGEALPAVWQSIRNAGGWDVLELETVPADSPLATKLPELACADGCRVHLVETHRAPWFEVEGIEERLHRRFRGDMRRLERQLGGVELERVSSFDRTALADLFRLEAAAWKGDAGTAIACDPKLVHYYTTLARVFARQGRLTLAFLRAKGKRIAGQLALEDGVTYYLIKVGYDPEFARFGPGQILVRETAADAHRRGLRRYDMMGKDTPWKLKWTDTARTHARLTIYAPTALGRTRWFVRRVLAPVLRRAWVAVTDSAARAAGIARRAPRTSP
jgi:CelD/BcsL family acetyltransferase involved in cellulose biosynthesis